MSSETTETTDVLTVQWRDPNSPDGRWLWMTAHRHVETHVEMEDLLSVFRDEILGLEYRAVRIVTTTTTEVLDL